MNRDNDGASGGQLTPDDAALADALCEAHATLDGGATAWVVAVLVTDLARPDLSPVPVLIVAPTVTTHTGDLYPGAEAIDLILSGVLGKGFALVAALEPVSLNTLPRPLGWSLTLDPAGYGLTIDEPGGVLYAGDLGAPLPQGWHQALRRRGQLALLVGTNIDPGEPPRDLIEQACRAGNVAGALLNAMFQTDSQRT